MHAWGFSLGRRYEIHYYDRVKTIPEPLARHIYKYKLAQPAAPLGRNGPEVGRDIGGAEVVGPVQGCPGRALQQQQQCQQQQR